MNLDSFAQELSDLESRYSQFDTLGPLNVEPAELLARMSAALEELRAANTELQAQSRRLVEIEEALDRERRRAKGLWEGSPFGFVVTDCIGLMRYTSPSASALLGMRPERLEKKPLALFVAEEDRAAFRTWLCDIAQGLASEKRDLRMMAATSDGFVVSAWGVLGDDSVSGAPEVRWALVDVTSDRRRERDVTERLHEAERRLVDLELRSGGTRKP